MTGSHRYIAPEGAAALRARIRAFIAANRPALPPEARATSWTVASAEFSHALGEAGWLGMTWPAAYGGGERLPLERYIVLEELLAAGAPVGAHWIADRQTGPLLLRYGIEAQRRRWLPPMALGRAFACIGLSEPGAGSDLAAVRTTATRTAAGWRIDGQKLWTTGAHRAHVMIALVRSEAGSERTRGLSQFLIPMDTPGVGVLPVMDLTGEHDFNEVFFDGVELGADALVGVEGDGWRQVTAELALERSGPERYLSSHAALVELMRRVGPAPGEGEAALIGRLVAELWTLRQMSLGAAAKLAAGEDPVVEAAIIKDLGNSYEQAVPTAVLAAMELDLAVDAPLERMLALLVQIAPSFSLRGGTREVLRGIIARSLGLR